MNSLHRESGEKRPEQILFHQFKKMAFVFFFITYFMVAVEWKAVELTVLFFKFVEGIDPAPHIHEQMATANYVQMATTLRTLLRITTSRLSTLRWTTRTPSRTWTRTTRSTEHTARRPLMHIGFTSHLVAQVRLVRVIPSMHVHLCLASWLFSPRLSRFLPRLIVLLPALPDVHLSAQREVQVQPPVRLPLGDRGHIRLRDTPHRLWAQKGLEPYERWRARPRYHQWYLLAAHPGRRCFLPSTIPMSTTTSLRNSLQLWSIEQGNLLRWEAIMIQFFLWHSKTWKVLRVSFL